MVIPLRVNRLKKNCWVCSVRSPQPLVVGSSFLVIKLRVTSDSMISLIFYRSALVWVRDESVVV